MKTSVDIPDDLWKAAKILAVEESKDLRDVIIEALQEHLSKKVKAKNKRGGNKNESCNLWQSVNHRKGSGR